MVNLNNLIISGSWDQSIKIWNSSTFELIHNILTSNSVVSLTLISNKNNIISGSDDNTINIWDSTTYELINTLNKYKTKKKEIL